MQKIMQHYDLEKEIGLTASTTKIAETVYLTYIYVNSTVVAAGKIDVSKEPLKQRTARYAVSLLLERLMMSGRFRSDLKRKY